MEMLRPVLAEQGNGPADPVFVRCAARTGSTLPRFLLDAHPDLACRPETELPGHGRAPGHAGLVNPAGSEKDHAPQWRRAEAGQSTREINCRLTSR